MKRKKKLVRIFDNDNKEITHEMTAEYREYLTDVLNRTSKGLKIPLFTGVALLTNK